MVQVGRLNGKVAVVTGAAGGIGEAICERFLAEGSKVMMVDCNLENLKKIYERFHAKFKDRVAMIEGDASKENLAPEAFSTAHFQFGQKCNILVNCAGICHVSPIAETTLASLNHVFDVNLIDPFLLTREFLQHLCEKKDTTGASIVNISSLAAKTGYPSVSAYAASKGGLVAFTKTTRIEVGKFGVRCNAVMPGVIDTPMLQGGYQAQHEALRQMIPMGRFGKPFEVANACLFLASYESYYINGATLEVAGGC